MLGSGHPGRPSTGNGKVPMLMVGNCTQLIYKTILLDLILKKTNIAAICS